MATVEQTMMKVQRLLTGPLGLQVTLREDLFQVQFSDMSTSLFIRCRDWGQDRDGDPQTLVVLRSYILGEVPVSPALYEWVARNSGSRWFGHIQVFDEEKPGTVSLVMTHTLLGDYLDEKELEAAMYGVLVSADELDDELKQRFGGKRWSDS